MYYATVEKKNGETETVNAILQWECLPCFLYLNGTDFEIFLSPSEYVFINIQEGSL